MADEKLRLEAEVRDNMSPALRKIRDTLNSIRASPSMKAATTEMRNLGTETAKFATFGGSAATALDAIGIGGLATAGSLAGVVLQMRALGERSLEMKELSRETQVSVDWLNAWSHAGLSFGVSADSMQESLNHLTSQMPQFKNHIGELYGLLSQKWPNLTKKLLGEDSEHQIHDIIGFLDQLKNQPQLQKQLAGEFFGNGADIEKLMRNGAKGFFDEFNKQQKALNPINPDLLKQSQQFRDATIQFNDALENFENRIGPTFLKNMTGIVGEAQHIVDVLNSPLDPKSWFNAARDIWDHSALGAVGRLEDRAANAIANKIEGKPSNDDAAPQKSAPAPSGRNGVYHKSSFDGGDGGLFHRTSFTGTPATGSTFGLAGIIADGTKSGVIAAFREMMATNEAANGNASGGFQQASYEAGGRRSIYRGFGGGSDSGDLPDSGASNVRLNAKGGMAARAKETYDFWRKLGASREAALGFVGNEQGEGTLGDGKTHLHWDRSHYSGGLVQWDPARRAAIQKALGIDVWHDTNHLHQLQAEAWELRNRYPKLFEALKHAKSVSAAAGALVQHYELPADKYGQSRYRAGLGMAWGKRLHDDRRATGLASNPTTGSAKAAAATQGHIRADIHVHGAAHKATVKTTGRIEASLHRWPKMSDVA